MSDDDDGGPTYAKSDYALTDDGPNPLFLACPAEQLTLVIIGRAQREARRAWKCKCQRGCNEQDIKAES